MYNLNFFCGFLVAGGTYALLCRLLPITAASSTWKEVDPDDDPDALHAIRAGVHPSHDDVSSSVRDIESGLTEDAVAKVKS